MRVLFVVDDYIIDPLGIGYLSSALKKAGHLTHIIKLTGNSLLERFIKEFQVFKPDILAYSVTTGWHVGYLVLNSFLKHTFKFISVFGGAHPTFFPEMADEPDVDCIVRGEGERSFIRLIDYLEMFGVPVSLKEWFDPELLKIDAIPFPDRKLLYQFPKNRNNPIKNFMASRGCPYNCTYCFNHSYKKLYPKYRVRYRDPDSIIEEIAEVKKKYPLELVYFQDDVFTTNKDWLKKLMLKFRTKIGLPFHCHIRPDMNESYLDWLKLGKCFSVTMAIESGSQDIRKHFLDRHYTNEQTLKLCENLHRRGIKFRIENMVGLPTERIKEAYETLNLNIKCKPVIGWASLYQPYPRTELGERCEEMGLYDGDVNKIKPNFFKDTVLNHPHKREFNNLQKLFSLVVSYPWLKPFLKVLVKLPENRYYENLYFWWKKRRYDRELYATRVYK